jgi:hypothetical protein
MSEAHKVVEATARGAVSVSADNISAAGFVRRAAQAQPVM